MKLVTMLVAVLVAAVLTTAAFGAAGSKTGGMPVIDVTMDGSSISVTGSLFSGAVDIHTTTTGDHSGSPIFVRLNDGVTADELLAFLQTTKANDPNNVAPYGSIVFDAAAGPGTNDIETILQPGNYVAIEGAVNGPTPPYATFSIATSSSPQVLPPADQWQKSVEYRFRGPGTFHVGQIMRASNPGWLAHMAIGFQVKNPAVGHQVMAYLRAGKDGKIQKLVGPGSFNLFGPVSHGAVQQFTLNAAPGWYVEACFMDTQDGREHTQLGMERLIHIVK